VELVFQAAVFIHHGLRFDGTGACQSDFAAQTGVFRARGQKATRDIQHAARTRAGLRADPRCRCFHIGSQHMHPAEGRMPEHRTGQHRPAAQHTQHAAT
jgi:hypothetical protein